MKLMFEIIQTDTVKHYDRKEYIAVTLYSVAMKENDNRRASEPTIVIPKTLRNERAWSLGRRVIMDVRLLP